jgi:hypothetical protein
MEAGIPTRLTAAQGRRFGLTVGLAFAAIGLLLLWRAKPVRAEVALTLGGLLIIAALTVPTRLGPLERAWMGLAHLISKVTTPVFMGIVYFVIITPIGWVRRVAGKSMTSVKGREASRWVPHAPVTAERMERQF